MKREGTKEVAFSKLKKACKKAARPVSVVITALGLGTHYT